MGSVRIASVYSWGCRKTGSLKVDKNLEEFILSRKLGEEEVLVILKKLKPYSSYLKLSEMAGDKNQFSRRVIESYWLGSGDLKKFGNDLPFHNFETLFLVLPARKNEQILKKILAEAVDCCVLPGIVKKILKNEEADIEYRSIEYKTGKFYIGPLLQKKIKTKFLKNFKIGDFISIHLGYGREKLNASERDSLLIWTQRTLNILNEK